MKSGPQPLTHPERMELARDIAGKFRQKFGADLLALGLYGSLARGGDGPHSDIEMFCVVRGEGVDTPYEWCEGAWKAEVNVLSPDVLLEQAAEFEESWPLTHGAFVHILPFYDPENFFAQLPPLVFGHSEDEFKALMGDAIVWEVFEYLGKIRNAVHAGNLAALPMFLLGMCKTGAYIIGLNHRHLYSTASSMLAESLALPERPCGYDTLCQAAMRGNLSDPSLAEDFWDGLDDWAREKGLKVYQKLDDLLQK